MNQIPLVNLKRQYQEIKPAIHEVIDAVLENTAFIKGPFASEFEEKFASLYGGAFVTGCSNGTSAISLALEALGVGSGDEVIVPTHTFIATAEAVCHVGATPVFVECDAETYCMDIAALGSAITDKTRAIIPVHIYGNAVDMNALQALLDSLDGKDIAIIEDCAQAHLAKLGGEFVGLFGNAGTFSFYPGKNLGAYGDAGAVISKNAELVTRIKKLADHGRLSKYEHDIIGYNYRMDGLQGAVLSVKADYLKQWTARRREVAAQYDAFVDHLGLKRIQSIEGCEPVYHLYVVEVENRDAVQAKMKEQGVATGVHYPVPLHLQPAFQDGRYKKGSFPVTEQFCERILSLPICGSISDEEVERVCAAFKGAL